MAGDRPLLPVNITHTIALINTEETIVLPQDTVDWSIRLRNTTQSAKVAFKVSESGSNFRTLDTALPELKAEDVYFHNQTLFVQSPDLAILEVIAYR